MSDNRLLGHSIVYFSDSNLKSGSRRFRIDYQTLIVYLSRCELNSLFEGIVDVFPFFIVSKNVRTSPGIYFYQIVKPVWTRGERSDLSCDGSFTDQGISPREWNIVFFLKAELIYHCSIGGSLWVNYIAPSRTTMQKWVPILLLVFWPLIVPLIHGLVFAISKHCREGLSAWLVRIHGRYVSVFSVMTEEFTIINGLFTMVL
jgi:hypothetical protein